LKSQLAEIGFRLANLAHRKPANSVFDFTQYNQGIASGHCTRLDWKIHLAHASIKKDAGRIGLRLCVFWSRSAFERDQQIALIAATTSTGSGSTTRSWITAVVFRASTFETRADLRKTALLARVNGNVNADQLFSGDTFADAHQFLRSATAFVGDAHALQSANFFLNSNALQLLASFYATRIWLAAATVLGSSNHRATKCDTHDRGKQKLEHWSNL
jgi:hypothetical protein